MKNYFWKQHTNISLKALIFVTGLFIFNSSSAQTNVSGGIYSNTTWTTAGSPYIITDTVVVFGGVTLTIQPGVMVKFDSNTYIEIRGNIYASGTVADTITFTSNLATPMAGDYDGIVVSTSNAVTFRYCKFLYAENAILQPPSFNPISHCSFISNITGLSSPEGGSIDTCLFLYDSNGMAGSPYNGTIGCTFLYNGSAFLGANSGSITNCTMKYNDYGINGSGGIFSAQNCIIDSNRIIGVLSYGAGDTITNCSIQYNYVGVESASNIITLNNISNNYIGIETEGDNISCNTICSNTHYNMVSGSPYNFSVSNNYWCLPDSSHIQATIYDAYQDISLGFIYFTPFDSTPCTHLCSLSVSTTATQMTVCHDSTILTVNVTDANPVYTVVWNPGNYHGLSYTVSPASDVTYTVVVTDSSGCKDSAYITIDTSCAHICNLSLYPYASSPIVCSGDSTTLIANVVDTSTYTAVWNPGNYHGLNYTVNPIYDITYTVVVTDVFGCKDSAYVTVDTVNCAPPPCGSALPPPICYVTTDTSSTFNTVVWQKVGMDTLAIDSIVIYRENILDQYVPIGKVSVHAPTLYNDYTARPNVEPSFYELGIIDTCGADSNLSSFNETVFLETSTGFGPHEANLSWNFYQGDPVVYYRILRDDSGMGNWNAIDSVNASINAYTDRSAPSNAGLRYMISTDWNVVCTPFYAIRPHVVNPHYAFSRSGSYSNISYLYPTGIVNIFNNNSINIFPNPVNSSLSISFNQSFDGSVTITDVLGQEVYSDSHFTAEKGNTEQLNVSALSSGIYIITLQSSEGIVRKKIVKN